MLSGGERALTAVAMLLALIEVEHSPFCILDEIDAALDESNIRRFADFLFEFSKKTPLIAITHRKPTMERAEVAYGVTTHNGASKIWAIKL